MLTAKEIDSLPLGTFTNSWLRKKFGPKHGSFVRFQDKEGKVHTFVCNRWWRRFRNKHPLQTWKSKTHNIETEFKQRYGGSKAKRGWWLGFFSVMKEWFKKLVG